MCVRVRVCVYMCVCCMCVLTLTCLVLPELVTSGTSDSESSSCKSRPSSVLSLPSRCLFSLSLTPDSSHSSSLLFQTSALSPAARSSSCGTELLSVFLCVCLWVCHVYTHMCIGVLWFILVLRACGCLCTRNLSLLLQPAFPELLKKSFPKVEKGKSVKCCQLSSS